MCCAFDRTALRKRALSCQIRVLCSSIDFPLSRRVSVVRWHCSNSGPLYNTIHADVE